MRTERSALHPMPTSRRVTLPVLLALLVFLGGSAYLMYRMRADSARRDEGNAPFAGALDPEDLEDEGDGGWRHHDWGPGEGAEYPPGPAPDRHGRIPPSPPDDEVWDPQMNAMRRSYGLQGDAGVAALPFEPTERPARVTDVEGTPPVSAGARCEVRVLPVETHAFNCLVRVICDGRVLYPNPSQTAGYAPCEVEDGRPVGAVDHGHTAADGDPRIRVDLRAGTVTVGDRGDGVDAYRATLRIGR